jgi:PAS domain S-box-containing protein
MVARIKNKKSTVDQRTQIDGAKIVKEKEAAWKKFCTIQRTRKFLKRRRIRKESDAILKEVLEMDDATVTSNVTVPKTLAEALPSDLDKRNADQRAIVVTEATGSFNMVGCNKAWENLCGFAECEIVCKDSSVLQGPDTNYAGLHDAVARLFEGEQKVNVVTTNYRKDGSKFINFLTLAPLRDEASGKMTHFVAILNDVGDKIKKRNKA